MYNQEISLLPNIILYSVIELFCVALNLFSISILIYIKTLHRPSNYLIISALLGALLQSLIIAPHFMLNQVGQLYSVRNLTWINCFVYSVSKDIMKISLLFVSMCQLGSIRYPYVYLELVTRKMVVLISSIMWVVIIIINIIPFCLHMHNNTTTSDPRSFYNDQAAYQDGPGSRLNHFCNPSKYWQICTVLLFDLIPFIVINSTYLVIWRTALRISKKDKILKKRIRRIQHEDENTQENQTLLAGDDNGVNEEHGESSYKEIPITTEENIEFLTTESEQKYTNKNSSSCHIIPSLCKLKATKTTLLLLSTYVICWGPIDTIEIIDAFRHILYGSSHSHNYLFIQGLSFSSSILLPLVYCWRSKQFRMKVNQLIFRKPYRVVQESLAEIPEMVLAQYTALTRETRHKAASFISNVSSLLSS